MTDDNNDWAFATHGARGPASHPNEGEHSEPIFATSSLRLKNAPRGRGRLLPASEPGNIIAFHQSHGARVRGPGGFGRRRAVRRLRLRHGRDPFPPVWRCRKADHIVSSRSIFGATVLLVNNYLRQVRCRDQPVPLATTPPGKRPSGRDTSCCSWKRRPRSPNSGDTILN